jgi:uncharacterized protein
MTPFYFGADDRRLFGTFHARNPAVAASHAVLLCNAYGREAIQLHRLFRVLADRLTRSGCDVLRFDYYGTGESAGDDLDANLDAWEADVMTARRELAARSPGSRLVLVGARLGATLAQRAAASVSPFRLVLLDPVADGRDYLDTLRAQHVDVLTEYERRRMSKAGRSFRDDPSQYLAEASGFAVPRKFCDQLREIRFSTPQGGDVAVICDAQSANGAALTASVGASPGVQLLDFSHGADWTSSLVPAQVINLLVSTVAAGHG